MFNILQAGADSPLSRWYFWVGLIAAICISIFSMPQLIRVLKTKNTTEVPLLMYILLTFGDFCFALNGIGVLCSNSELAERLAAGLPLLLANLVACSTAAIVLFIKLRNMHYAKKFQTTEKQFCENYEAYKTKIRMAKAEKEAAKKLTVNEGEKPANPEQTSSSNGTPVDITIG